jgi:UDP-N-acetylglucosamine:LPS N-acetylglucosamine transferase
MKDDARREEMAQNCAKIANPGAAGAIAEKLVRI